MHYSARAAGYTLFLTTRGPVFSFNGSGTVNLSLLHGNHSPRVEGVSPLAARTNYFIGARAKWVSGVPNYERVRYHDVYPGVDIIYYGSQNQLEYDFLLQPGADPNNIRLRFNGAGRLSITPAGDLAIETRGGQLVQKKPLIYQESADGSTRQEIAGQYKLISRGVVGLTLEAYDRSRPLVVDPIVSYSTFMGGSGADMINAVKLGSNGLLYVAGSTTNSDLFSPDGAYKQTNTGATDIFVAVIAPSTSGTYALQYLTYLGGTLADAPTAMDVDSSGVVYLAGSTMSTDFPMVGASVQSSYSGTVAHPVVVLLNPANYGGDGLVYSSYLGGTGTDTINGIAAGPGGKIYVIGTTNSTDFPVTGSAYQSVTWGPQDTFLCEIDPSSSSPVYSTYLGGESADDGRAIAVSPSGLVYFAASTISTQFPMAGNAYNPNFSGIIDVVIGVMDMTQSGVNSLVYCTYFGGSDLEEVRKIALDASGDLLVTGFTFSNDFPITADAVQSTNNGNGDVFVSRVNPSARPGDFVTYSTYLGGSQGEVAYDIAGDQAGSIYVTGYTLSPDYPVTGDAALGQYGNGVEIFLTKLQPGKAGADGLQYSTYFGDLGIHVATGLAVGPDGTIYVAGYSTTGLYTTGSAAQGAYGGGSSDGFLTAFGN